jgi:copper chaperone CopZ
MKAALDPLAESSMSETTTGSRELLLHVTGMTCGMCVKHVTKALLGLPGVSKAEVTLTPGAAVVTYDPAKVSPEAMFAAVRDAGYEARD